MSKYLDIKSIIEDLNDMVVELRDNDITVEVWPPLGREGDIQTKMISIGRTEYLSVVFNFLQDKKIYYHLIYDKICSVIEYMKESGYNTLIGTKITGKGLNHSGRIALSGLEKNLNNKIYYIGLNFELINPVIYESLPNKKSVDQLKMVAKISKKTDIGNRLPDENGSNLAYIKNPIDNIESFEDYEKKNKTYIPSWNLKHLLSPFKGKTKIKKVNEADSNLYSYTLEFDKNTYDIIYEEDMIPDTDYGVYKSYDNDKKYLVLKKDIEHLDSDNFTFIGLAVTKDYHKLAKEAKDKYQKIKDDVDLYRSDDELYEDPSEWYAFEEYSKYYSEGLWDNIFWDFVL